MSEVDECFKWVASVHKMPKDMNDAEYRAHWAEFERLALRWAESRRWEEVNGHR